MTCSGTKMLLWSSCRDWTQCAAIHIRSRHFLFRQLSFGPRRLEGEDSPKSLRSVDGQPLMWSLTDALSHGWADHLSSLSRQTCPAWRQSLYLAAISNALTHPVSVCTPPTSHLNSRPTRTCSASVWVHIGYFNLPAPFNRPIPSSLLTTVLPCAANCKMHRWISFSVFLQRAVYSQQLYYEAFLLTQKRPGSWRSASWPSRLTLQKTAEGYKHGAEMNFNKTFTYTHKWRKFVKHRKTKSHYAPRTNNTWLSECLQVA